ncbi:Germin-like protein subfamily 1 member 13 [Linum perenne]
MSSLLWLTTAYDPSPLQDFCVAIDDPKYGVNGKFCKDPMQAKADDFSFKGLNVPRDTSNQVGSNVTLLNVDQIPGLNTLGISLGTLYVGFVTSNPDNRLISKVLYPGDVFVFPIGLIHFQFNVDKAPAVAFAGLSSQNPGVITIANAVFGSNPPVNADVLTKAFQLDKDIVADLQKKFAKN